MRWLPSFPDVAALLFLDNVFFPSSPDPVAVVAVPKLSFQSIAFFSSLLKSSVQDQESEETYRNRAATPTSSEISKSCKKT